MVIEYHGTGLESEKWGNGLWLTVPNIAELRTVYSLPQDLIGVTL
jgi:hypothetical protein